jgi:phosphoribosyl-AMP cyclohydrolase
MTEAPQTSAHGQTKSVETGLVFMPRFDADGLIPAIVTDATDGTVLMFAWMNAASLTKSRATRLVHFWSRSRSCLWLKGEESGNTLQISEIAVDCDQDVLLIRATVSGAGVACHTGERSCFYRAIVLDGTEEPASLRLIQRDVVPKP